MTRASNIATSNNRKVGYLSCVSGANTSTLIPVNVIPDSDRRCRATRLRSAALIASAAGFAMNQLDGVD